MKSKIKLLMVFTLLSLIFIPYSNVQAAVAIKESGTVITTKTISEFFDMFLDMTEEGQGLEGMNVIPHMATDKDWETITYFSNSIYGTSGEGKNTGISIKINEKSHYSANGNITGVMDLGKTATYTAGVYYQASETSTGASTWENGKRLIEVLNSDENTELVNLSGGVRPLGYAIDLSGLRNGSINAKYPYSTRFGMFHVNNVRST